MPCFFLYQILLPRSRRNLLAKPNSVFGPASATESESAAQRQADRAQAAQDDVMGQQD